MARDPHETVFRLHQIAEGVLGTRIPIQNIYPGPPSLFPKDRDMAKTKWRTDTIMPFELAHRPDFFAQPADRVLGVLMHEFGHMSLLAQGRRKHSEVQADAEAGRLFGTRLYYDELHVQTVLPTAISTRPAYLHQ